MRASPEEHGHATVSEYAKPPGFFKHSYKRVIGLFSTFNHQLSTSQAFADHFGNMLDTWLGIIRFIAYNLIAVLIFAINTKRYSDVNY